MRSSSRSSQKEQSERTHKTRQGKARQDRIGQAGMQKTMEHSCSSLTMLSKEKEKEMEM